MKNGSMMNRGGPPHDHDTPIAALAALLVVGMGIYGVVHIIHALTHR